MRANFRNKKMVLFTQDTNQICIPAPPPTSCILQSLLFYEKAKSNAFLRIRLFNKSFSFSFTKIFITLESHPFCKIFLTNQITFTFKVSKHCISFCQGIFSGGEVISIYVIVLGILEVNNVFGGSFFFSVCLRSK